MKEKEISCDYPDADYSFGAERTRRFMSYENHAFLHKIFKKLKANERMLALNFLNENANLSNEEFEFKMNRLFINKEKPKNWAIILELLCNANTRGLK